MIYKVYWITKDGANIHIADTLYYHDAHSVLINWHEGYILKEGLVVWKKVDGKGVSVE